ncbi:vacuole effluxer Atg22 like-domain-containing protein [Suillus subalutaceus]|uniref:vacuole effluxer Atg22 like-domain-containing protein n=1 Tax=Suillus subalutaceus TaxID=48586 RepID=UPI001B8656F5|nr:vacuole effluxer Atg22 like-domain-containing protein [Suillus subalutaceus]KAG1831185.1 vacuole effluxer Atg22 like-domain-containing protein [Suillus subalutaceus]
MARGKTVPLAMTNFPGHGCAAVTWCGFAVRYTITLVLNIYKLNSIVLGNDPCRVFEIKIAPTESVSTLQKVIKDAKKPQFDRVAADGLEIWLSNADDLIIWKVKINLNDLVQSRHPTNQSSVTVTAPTTFKARLHYLWTARALPPIFDAHLASGQLHNDVGDDLIHDGDSVVCWAAQYASMALTTPNRWVLAMVLYIIGFVSYGATLVFYAALFPRLARNTPHARQLREKYESGEIPPEVYEQEESLEKNRISNISTVYSNVGYIITLSLNLALLLPMTNNPKVDNYVLVFVTTYWVEPRPGPSLPEGEHYMTIGWKQIWATLKTYKHLPYTFAYLFSFFLLADVLFGCLSPDPRLTFSWTRAEYYRDSRCHLPEQQVRFLVPAKYLLGLSQAIASTISTLVFWYIQRYWKISTKKMFVVTNVVTILIPLWGMIGIWTEKLGFHNVWEFWFNIVFGLFQAPYYAFSQIMMAELSLPGFDNMFFGLFGLSNRASSMVGPNVIQVIINRTGNDWQGFPFLFALCTAASVVIWFGVDVTNGRMP